MFMQHVRAHTHTHTPPRYVKCLVSIAIHLVVVTAIHSILSVTVIDITIIMKSTGC